MIRHSKLQRGITQPILRFFDICTVVLPRTHLDGGGLERLLLGGVGVRADLSLDLLGLLVALGRRPREAVPKMQYIYDIKL